MSTGRPAPDPWIDLRAHTPARLALGRAGHAVPTDELLRFGLAHAQARDAVHLALDVPALQSQLAAAGRATLQVQSAAPDRATYLLRPDLGRRLSEAGIAQLEALAAQAGGPAGCDLLLVVADGLSSAAIARNAVGLVEAIHAQAPEGWRIGPVVVATQARVALGDDIGALLRARLVAVLVGERPGLSSPDSLGIYLTWAPRTGRSDAERNCISNVRPEGLAAELAAARLWWLCQEARVLRLTGVGLKDRSEEKRVGADAALAPALSRRERERE